MLLPTAAQWSYVSSTLVREIAMMHGDVSAFVPTFVVDALRARASRPKDRS